MTQLLLGSCKLQLESPDCEMSQKSEPTDPTTYMVTDLWLPHYPRASWHGSGSTTLG
ncbi:hypothetical protein BGZ61DRAFT_458767 [Ilyonectria robusta]|uniref:uncharacterized protein n=1 Tax=Ilyonectria robusta TaxID=1079257 RepID=UPI001E8D72EB|nr:uncharacterized protein BGZ61DRAFT_458767 [Ilyonectria robusta]KAH8673070.1 hypothetical protein BGZ61DRAFT_458767 [Ilyonectria robusta]